MRTLDGLDYKFNIHHKGEVWRLVSHVGFLNKDEANQLVKDIKINHDVVCEIKQRIRQMELAEVDVQNWLSEEGHKQHTALLDYLKRLLQTVEAER